MASTGLNLEADQAGKNPKTTPVMAEIPRPITMFVNVRVMVESAMELATRVTIKISNNPISPPSTESKTDSYKNCIRIK